MLKGRASAPETGTSEAGLVIPTSFPDVLIQLAETASQPMTGEASKGSTITACRGFGFRIHIMHPAFS